MKLRDGLKTGRDWKQKMRFECFLPKATSIENIDIVGPAMIRASAKNDSNGDRCWSMFQFQMLGPTSCRLSVQDDSHQPVSIFQVHTRHELDPQRKRVFFRDMKTCYILISSDI